jgi:hypothetical protein
MIKAITAASAILAMTAATALDAAAPLLQPMPYANATLRHYQGQPTVAVKGRAGAVEIAPLAMDHGCANFGVTVFNNSDRPADIDLSDVTVFVGDRPAAILTVNDLQKRADKRAFWTSMAVAAVGGLSAGIAAASNSHATIRSSGRYGTHVTRISYHDGAANAALISGATIATASSIQEKGRREAAAAGEEILGLTTVDPGDAYGGRVVIDKIKDPLPQTIFVSVKWNGEVYTTKWQLAPEGTPAPLFTPAAEAAPVAGAAPAIADRSPVTPAALPIGMPAPAAPSKPVAGVRPKQYSHDDTVQVPM